MNREKREQYLSYAFEIHSDKLWPPGMRGWDLEFSETTDASDRSRQTIGTLRIDDYPLEGHKDYTIVVNETFLTDSFSIEDAENAMLHMMVHARCIGGSWKRDECNACPTHRVKWIEFALQAGYNPVDISHYISDYSDPMYKKLIN